MRSVSVTVAIRTKSREPSSHTKLRSLRMSRPHAPVAIWSHERPSRDTAARPPPTVTTRDDRRRELEKAEADRRGDEAPGKEPDRPDRDAADAAEHDHHAHEAARESNLRGGDEVGHVSLEGTLRGVRRDLEQDDECDQRDVGVRRRDAGEEHDVENRTYDEVWLAAPPSGDRVVGDRADRRLHQDRDNGAEKSQQRQAGALAVPTRATVHRRLKTYVVAPAPEFVHDQSIESWMDEQDRRPRTGLPSLSA